MSTIIVTLQKGRPCVPFPIQDIYTVAITKGYNKHQKRALKPEEDMWGRCSSRGRRIITLARGTWHILTLCCDGSWDKDVTCATCVVLVLLLLFYKRFPQAYISEIRHGNNKSTLPNSIQKVARTAEPYKSVYA
jgi:hypothetical protein